MNRRDDYVKIGVASRVLGISAERTRALVDRGQLPAIKFGRERLVSHAALVRFQARRLA